MTFDRRSLLLGSAALATEVALGGCKEQSSERTPSKNSTSRGQAPKQMSEAAFATLVAVAERLIPSEGAGPGAKEAGVAQYFERAFADVQLAHVVPMLKRAAGFLNRAARSEYKSSHFAALSAEQMDAILTKLDAGRLHPRGFSGRQFLQVMMALTLEGYLGAPSHGGNTDQIAWRWLGFHEGGMRRKA